MVLTRLFEFNVGLILGEFIQLDQKGVAIRGTGAVDNRCRWLEAANKARRLLKIDLVEAVSEIRGTPEGRLN